MNQPMASPEPDPTPESPTQVMANRNARAGRLLDRLMDVFEAELDRDDLPAPTLNVIRQFLKDNSISTTTAPGGRAAKLGSTIRMKYGDDPEDTDG